MTYTYNPDNSLHTITYPSGRVVTESYDAIGRMLSIADATTTYLSGLSYNGAGQATAFQYGNGVQAAFTYNDHLQLATLRYSKTGAADLLSLKYDYTSGTQAGNNGQIQAVHFCTTDPATCSENLAKTENFTYDPWSRLGTARTGDGTSWGLSWQYDRFGNRLQQNVTAGSAPAPSVSVDPATNRINSSGYAYDAAGNMIWDSIHDYAYDAENRLTVVDPQLNPVGATYTYLGALRVKKVAGSTTTVYVYSGTKPIAEYATDANGTKLTEYIYAGAGTMLATIHPDGSITYQHPDHLSIRAESDSNGNVIRSTGNFPFGEQWYDTSPGSKWQFTTYERDSESQLDYAVFRAYSSRLGRFMQADLLPGSMVDPESLDRYTYVLNDPEGLVDPLGLCQYMVVPTTFIDPATGQSYGGFSFVCLPGSLGGGPGAGMHAPVVGTPDTDRAGGGKDNGNCDLTPLERGRLAGEAVINLNSAAKKIGAAAGAGVSTPLTGAAGVAGALYEGLTAGPTVATGALQGVAAITGNRDIAEASNVSAIFTSVSGPATLVATGGNTEAASTASTLEALFTFGLSGAVSDVGASEIADAISNALDVVSPMKKPSGCK